MFSKIQLEVLLSSQSAVNGVSGRCKALQLALATKAAGLRQEHVQD